MFIPVCRLGSGLVISLALLITGPAMAQSTYLGLGGQAMFGLNDSSKITQSLLVSSGGGTANTEADQLTLGGRIFGGLQLNESVALEFGYLLSTDADYEFSGVSGSGAAYSGGGSASLQGFDASAIVRLPKDSRYHDFFVQLGITQYELETDASVTSGGVTGRDSSRQDGSGYVFGLGYDFRSLVSDTTDLRLGLSQTGKIAGESDNSTTNVGVSLIRRFD